MLVPPPAPFPGGGATVLQPLVHLGASFPTADAAARAADRALIALQGRQQTSSALNFPEGEYGAEEQRRYGPALSAFLAELCHEAARETAEVRREALREKDKDALQRYYDNVDRSQAVAMRRLKRDPLFVTAHKRCGICPGCRQASAVPCSVRCSGRCLCLVRRSGV